MQSITQTLGRHLGIFRKPEVSTPAAPPALPITVESFSRGITPAAQQEIDNCKWAVANRPQLTANQGVPQMQALNDTRLAVLQENGVRQAVQISSSLLGSAGAALHFAFDQGNPTATLHQAGGRTSQLPVHLNEKGALQARLPNGNSVSYSSSRTVADVTFSSENDARASAKYILADGAPLEPAPQHTSLEVTRHDGGLTTLLPDSSSLHNAGGSHYIVGAGPGDRLYDYQPHPADPIVRANGGAAIRGVPGSQINPTVHHVISTLIPARDSALHQLNMDFPIAPATHQNDGWLTSLANKVLG